MKKFKFALGEKVFILGLPGVNIVTGRGQMEYISGGKLNIYQIDGSRQMAPVLEQILLTFSEYKKLLEVGE